jgi:hydroxymethylpyrimidine pyrophosphatase-like HAD family hydrolase
MRYFAFACDFDGTIAEEGRVSDSTLKSLQRVAESGRKLILVTGRHMDDLLQVFPGVRIFDRVIAENGAVLYRPSTGDSKLLALAPPQVFISTLQRLGVEPLAIGECIVATAQPQDETVLRVIRELGLELQVIYNKGAVMVLPSGVNKGTGICAALAELALSEHNAVGVGDAENDHALLNTCECGVAVANAIPTLKEHADLVLTAPDGKGIEELVEMIVGNDLRGMQARLTRHNVVLGADQAGDTISIATYDKNFLIVGPSASGKSTTVLAVLGRLLDSGHQVALVDPEGDYANVTGLISFGGPKHPPELDEVMHALQTPKTSVGVNLLGLPLPDRPLFFASLLPKLQELRLRTGRPHSIIVDEAHHMLGEPQKPALDPLPKWNGFILVTVHPEAIAKAVLQSVDGVIAVGAAPPIAASFSEGPMGS